MVLDMGAGQVQILALLSPGLGAMRKSFILSLPYFPLCEMGMVMSPFGGGVGTEDNGRRV
jgi:hypothetical protein